MTEGPARDRRKKQRISRRLPVRFGTEAKMIGGTALDIADGGLRVESAESFPHNSVVDVFVQFPRHSVRLRARIIWSGGGQNKGGLPVVGLAFTQPEPALAKAYAEWLAEVKLASREAGGASGPVPVPASAGPTGDLSGKRPEPAARSQPAPRPPEPIGPVRKKVETRRGNAYAILMERRGAFWRLTISAHPRQPGVGAADLEETFTDHASAESALQNFLKNH
jgi:hypothetical protein